MTEKIKILHLEDNQLDAELISEMLKLGGLNVDIKVVHNRVDFLSSLDDVKVDLVISDYNLPDWDGLKALLATRKKSPDIPFIYVSGTIGEDRAVQCLQLGAMDYVMKNRLDRIVPAVKRALRLVKEIRERKKIEKELAHIKLAIENTDEAIILTDPDAKFIFVNPAFCEMYGWRAEEVVEIETPRILKSGAHADDFYMQLWKDIKSNKSFRAEMINKTRLGRNIDIKNTINPVIDERNNLIGYVSVQNDISLSKQYERNIIAARNEAEEMNKLKSYFLSNISHEMRTPLISILGFSEILMNEVDKPEHKEFIQYVYNSGKRLHNTINDIFSLQELERKLTTVKNQKFEFTELLKNICSKFLEKALKKGINLKVEAMDQEIWMNSDPIVLEKVINNIVDNSIKFTKKGEVTVSISHSYLENNPQVIIKIADTGIGISENKLKNLFTPFRQESEGINRSYEGMGLGLSVAKQLLDLLQGKIDIQSIAGKGTIVSISLNILPPEKELKAQIDQKKTEITEATSSNSDKPKILLVEDNDGNRMIFRKYLEKDFIVDEAEDGISGISKAEMKQYNLILMDINLGGGIDGVETFHRIRKLPSYKDIPVIAITAYGMKGDKGKFLDEGFTEYVQKPVMKKDIINTCKSLLQSEKI